MRNTVAKMNEAWLVALASQRVFDEIPYVEWKVSPENYEKVM